MAPVLPLDLATILRLSLNALTSIGGQGHTLR